VDQLFLDASQVAAKGHESGAEKDHVQRLGQDIYGKGAGADEIGESPGIEQRKNNQDKDECEQYRFFHGPCSCYVANFVFDFYDLSAGLKAMGVPRKKNLSENFVRKIIRYDYIQINMVNSGGCSNTATAGEHLFEQD
jgi:hypothetical protein